MAVSLDDVHGQLVKLNNKLDDLVSDFKIGPTQIHIVEGLADISENLGLIAAGEFRAPANRNIPGQGFSGVRIVGEGVHYPDTSTADSDVYNIVGVDNDTLSFGLRSSDGTAIFSGGNSAMGARGPQYIGDTLAGGGLERSTRLIWYPSTQNLPAGDTEYRAIQIAGAAGDTEIRLTIFPSAPDTDQLGDEITSTDVLVRTRFFSLKESDAADMFVDSTGGIYISAGKFGLASSEAGGNSVVTMDSDGDVSLVSSDVSVLQIAPFSTGSASENLNHITPIRHGQLLVLMPNEDAVDIVVVDEASTASEGFFRTAGNFTMNSIHDRITLLAHFDTVERYWVELSRSDNA